jgi:hypothetical protein
MFYFDFVGEEGKCHPKRFGLTLMLWSPKIRVTGRKVNLSVLTGCWGEDSDQH